MNGKTSPSMRSHHGLYEVHLPVTDLDRAIDFYVEKLGFELGCGFLAFASHLLFQPRTLILNLAKASACYAQNRI